MSLLRSLTPLVVAGLLPVAWVHGQSAPIASRVIPGDIRGVVPCGVAATASSILRAVKAIGGVEYAAADCPPGAENATGVRDWIPLSGVTVGAALDRLVQLDPRYRWVETDGVIVIRPVESWEDRTHPLNRIVPSFELENADLAVSLWTIVATINGKTSSYRPQLFSGRTAQLAQPISVSAGPIAIVDALNAIVRAHGASRWQVRSCDAKVSRFLVTVGFNTHDGEAVMSDAVIAREDSRAPCARQ
jgi:hypothetical protein